MTETRFDVYSTEQLGSRDPTLPGARKIGLGPVSNVAARNVQDALEEMNTRAGAADASATGKGITRLSVPPADPLDPVAVGDNDPRFASPLSVANFEAPGTDQTINSDTTKATPLVLGVESWDDGGNFANSAFTVPRAGQYWLGGVCFGTAVEADSAVLLYVLLNGGVGFGDPEVRSIAGGQAAAPRSLVAAGGRPFRLVAGTTVRLGLLYGAPLSTDTMVVDGSRTRFYGYYMGV